MLVGELAKRAVATVRTLQFYDKNGLLKSTISEGGRRMYTLDDVLKLQQILFLKSFRFSLEQINDKLLSPKSPTDLETIFAGQREILLEQMGHLNKIVETLDAVIAETKTGREISLDKLMIIMNLMNQGNKYSFVIRYFKDEQLQRVAKRFDSLEKYNTIMDKSKVLFAQLENLYRKGPTQQEKKGRSLQPNGGVW